MGRVFLHYHRPSVIFHKKILQKIKYIFVLYHLFFLYDTIVMLTYIYIMKLCLYSQRNGQPINVGYCLFQRFSEKYLKMYIFSESQKSKQQKSLKVYKGDWRICLWTIIFRQYAVQKYQRPF